MYNVQRNKYMDSSNNYLMDNNVRITFSTDRFHKDIKEEVKEQYYKYSRGLNITEYAVSDEKIYKTGLSNIGKKYNYSLDNLKYFDYGDQYYIFGTVYMTARGFITSESIGQYSDMDRINMGHISSMSLKEMIEEYGLCMGNDYKIISGPVKKRRK